jgi:hypothetical protein
MVSAGNPQKSFWASPASALGSRPDLTLAPRRRLALGMSVATIFEEFR